MTQPRTEPVGGDPLTIVDHLELDRLRVSGERHGHVTGGAVAAGIAYCLLGDAEERHFELGRQSIAGRKTRRHNRYLRSPERRCRSQRLQRTDETSLLQQTR